MSSFPTSACINREWINHRCIPSGNTTPTHSYKPKQSHGWRIHMLWMDGVYTSLGASSIHLSHSWRQFQQHFTWPPPQVNRCNRIFAEHQSASRCPCTFSSVSLSIVWIPVRKNKNLKISIRKRGEGCFFFRNLLRVQEGDPKKTKPFLLKARGVVVAWGFSSQLSTTISRDVYGKTVWVNWLKSSPNVGSREEIPSPKKSF